MDCSKVVRLNREVFVVWERDAVHFIHVDDILCQRLRIVRFNCDSVRDLVEFFSNGVQVSKRKQTAIMQNDNLFSDALDFL